MDSQGTVRDAAYLYPLVRVVRPYARGIRESFRGDAVCCGRHHPQMSRTYRKEVGNGTASIN